MADVDGRRNRRVFRWPREARELVREYQQRPMTTSQNDEAVRRTLVAKLIAVSGNPRDACRRFLRQLGIRQKRSYREWTKAEQQRLLDLVGSVSVEEAATSMRRTPASVRSMLHRLEPGARRGTEWFTKSSLAAVLHIRPDEVQRWIDHGWLKCRVLETQGLKKQIIDPDDFCDFFKQYGRQVAGRRLSYEGLRFVRNYVFPPSHADLFSLRENYKKRDKNGTLASGNESERGLEESNENGFEKSA
jgi:hypothetical protein